MIEIKRQKAKRKVGRPKKTTPPLITVAGYEIRFPELQKTMGVE